LLNTQQLQHSVRGDDRERVTSARQAAEALFTPVEGEEVRFALDSPVEGRRFEPSVPIG
jgi:hypothetical protein